MKAVSEADIVIVTHLPSFYKTNLYNRLALSKKIFVIFIGLSSTDREKDFTQNDMNFPFTVINTTDFQGRNKILSGIKLLRLLYSINYKYVIVNGWDLPEFWLTVIVSVRAFTGVAVESSVYESNTHGLKGFSKRFFLWFVNFALPSGEPQLALLHELGFKKTARKVGGVGIPSLISRNYKTEPRTVNRFIFVGRLVPEKNLSFLIRFFNHHPEYELGIVGTGILEPELKQLAAANTRFLGYIPNKELVALFEENDILILPSIAEPWGLVVEEALQNGLPVVVSDRVGCHIDLIAKFHAGLVFRSGSEESLLESVKKMCDLANYRLFCSAIKAMDFNAFYEAQVNAYELNWVNA